MSSIEQRIAQFEHMAEADPENDMAHFSLGSAYAQAQRHEDAARAFRRCFELNPDMSKAYQLAARALIDAGRALEAEPILKEGYEVAAVRGDVMPRDAMKEMLAEIGAAPPELSDEAKEAAEQLRASGAFVCSRTGRPGTQLEKPPLPGPVGTWIQANISAETWQEWLGQGTKVINELRLDFSRDEDQAVYDRHMCEYLGIDPSRLEAGTAAG